jgi:hypothetical protein
MGPEMRPDQEMGPEMRLDQEMGRGIGLEMAMGRGMRHGMEAEPWVGVGKRIGAGREVP